jgi:uncharacterized membrane protein
MTVDVSTEIVIRRPRDQVAEYSANPDNAPEWYVNIKEVRWKSPPPMSLGSKIAFVANFLGRRLAYIYEIVDLQPGRRLVMRTKEGPFPMETTYTWEDSDGGGTRMRLQNRGSPVGFSSLLAPFMAISMRRANQKDLSRLKELLERRLAGG